MVGVDNVAQLEAALTENNVPVPIIVETDAFNMTLEFSAGCFVRGAGKMNMYMYIPSHTCHPAHFL